MSHFDTAGDKSNSGTTGPMGPPETHHVVCRECAFEELCSTSWAADALAREHRGETEHRLALARIE